MKALEQIIKRVAENPSHPWALATLVQTEGSTYRMPGARLLVERNGKTLGVLSGGCLEEEIGRYGQDVIATGSPVLLSFDTRRLYGCDGRLKILIEPLPAAGETGNLITKIAVCSRSETFAEFARVLKANCSAPSWCLLTFFSPNGTAFSSRRCHFPFASYFSVPGQRSNRSFSLREISDGWLSISGIRRNSARIFNLTSSLPRSL